MKKVALLLILVLVAGCIQQIPKTQPQVIDTCSQVDYEIQCSPNQLIIKNEGIALNNMIIEINRISGKQETVEMNEIRSNEFSSTNLGFGAIDFLKIMPVTDKICDDKIRILDQDC